MGADSPDDSLLFAGRRARCRHWSASGRGRTPFPSWSSAARMKSSPSCSGGIPACSSSTATALDTRASGWFAASRATHSRPSCPVTALAGDHHPEQVQAWFAAGADEVISGLFSPAEQRSRLDAMLVRTERDVSVHPSTRMPGTTEIEREIRRRLEIRPGVRGLLRGPRSLQGIQRPLQLLRRGSGHLPAVPDPARRGEGPAGARGFVGHIGGDDFIFIVPATEISPVLHRDPRGVRHADSAAVQRAGSPGGVLLRQGPPGPAAPGPADDPVDRHRDQPPPRVRAPGPGKRACHRDEELRQDAAGVGVRGGPSAGIQWRGSPGSGARRWP